MNLTQMKKFSKKTTIKLGDANHKYEFILNSQVYDKNSSLYNALCYIKLLPLLQSFDSKSVNPHKNFIADFDNLINKFATEEKHITIWKITNAFSTPVKNNVLPADLLTLLVRRAASFVLHDVNLHLDSNYDIVPKTRTCLTREECYNKISEQINKELQEK